MSPDARNVTNSLIAQGLPAATFAMEEMDVMVTGFAEKEKPLPSQPVSLLKKATLQIQAAQGIMAGSSLLFAILQSVCTFFAAVDGLRTLIGIGSLVLAESTAKVIDGLHADRLRVPMIAIAIAGSLLNLLVLWQIRRLRRNPAARWRQQPVSPRRLHTERLQFAMAILTLVLVAIEERQHLIWAGHL